MPLRMGFTKESNVEFGENFDTGYFVVVRTNVTIGDDVCIWSHTVIDPDVKIGNNVKIHCNCYISQRVVIEDDVFIGPGTQILNDRYPPRYDPEDWEPPIIRKGAIIGGGVTICPGVFIGEGSIIGAGTVVLRDVPDGQIWVGNPARRVR